MENHEIALLPDWPARSPDLNIIENRLAYLKDRVYQREVCYNLEHILKIVEANCTKFPTNLLLLCLNPSLEELRAYCLIKGTLLDTEVDNVVIEILGIFIISIIHRIKVTFLTYVHMFLNIC